MVNNLNKSILILLFFFFAVVQCVHATTVASFIASPTTGVAPLTVQFTDTSTGNKTFWSWTFCKQVAFPNCKVINNDAQGPNPVVVFTHSGTYPVVLQTGIFLHAPYATASETIVVTSPPTPISSFTATPSSDVTPTIQFTDTSTGNPSAWSWFFGDGLTSSEQNPLHTFTNPCNQDVKGRYHVALTIWNHYSDDPSTTSQKDIDVPIPPNPVSSFTTSQTSGTAPLTVQFADTTSNNPTKWVWNFGDGTMSYLKNPPSHTYTYPAIYSVTMVASTYDCSQSYPATRQISVLSPYATSTITSASPTISQTTPPTTTVVSTNTVTTATTTTTITAVPTTTQTTAITTIPTSVPITGQTTSITTVPTTSQTTITIVTPKPTETVNYSATIATMQSQIAEQNARITEQGNILNQIMSFLRNLFGWK